MYVTVHSDSVHTSESLAVVCNAVAGATPVLLTLTQARTSLYLLGLAKSQTVFHGPFQARNATATQNEAHTLRGQSSEQGKERGDRGLIQFCWKAA